jgi:hypothetical protein
VLHWLDQKLLETTVSFEQTAQTGQAVTSLCFDVQGKVQLAEFLEQLDAGTVLLLLDFQVADQVYYVLVVFGF